ncbi:glycosyltransferase [Leifsonia sp. LS-T14]|uniref:glycosyltransferase family 2 protein n=1 Tax=unclassified Leifsonia TaxID=2663824 RepID=UPI0035A69CCA
MSKMGHYRDSFVNRSAGFDVRGTIDGLRDSLDQSVQASARIEERLQAFRNETAETLAESVAELAAVRRRLETQLAATRQERDAIPELTARLAALRATPDYRKSWSEREPLVSVRIASYLKTEELVDVAIASVLAQTYDNFELIVVNDGPNDTTRRAVEGIGDPRISYSELPQRGEYPEDPHWRWMVAGSPAMNHAAGLATGVWIAPLDDDDEFTPDHLEKLVSIGVENEVELSYGALTQKHLVHGWEKRIWSSPPAISEFSFQGAIYLRALHDIFRYDERSWIVEEPGDWNLIRRMKEAGVTMACTTDVVAVMNMVPYTLKGDTALADATPEH